jgi:hypothetical protein
MTLTRIAVTVRDENNQLYKLEVPIYDKTPEEIFEIAGELVHKLLVAQGLVKSDKEIEI